MTIINEIKNSIFCTNLKYITLRDTLTQIKLITPFYKTFKGHLTSLIFIKFFTDMIAVSASILTNKSIVAKFMTRSLQTPLREIYKDCFSRNLWSNLKQTPIESAFNSIKIESYTWTKHLKFAKNIFRSPCMKPKQSSSVPKKPLILLVAGSFLGYHKDGKVIKSTFF